MNFPVSRFELTSQRCRLHFDRLHFWEFTDFNRLRYKKYWLSQCTSLLSRGLHENLWMIRAVSVTRILWYQKSKLTVNYPTHIRPSLPSRNPYCLQVLVSMRSEQHFLLFNSIPFPHKFKHNLHVSCVSL